MGSGCFGDVFACSFGFKGKIHCVIKIAKKGSEEELALEGRILRKLLDCPFDWRQKFFAFAYGYNKNHKGVVCERFFGFAIRQYATQALENNWFIRLIEIAEALSFMHERQILHLDLHSSNVLVSSETSKIIDFGKATLVNFPITFTLDCEERKEYNLKYKQIEFELRNEKNVQTKKRSDVYSLGVLISIIAKNCLVAESTKPILHKIAESCCAQRATRSSLVLVLADLKEFNLE